MSRRLGRRVTLGNVPPEEWDAITLPATDAVWLMGVWERSPTGLRIAREHPGLCEEYFRALPGWMPDDVVGSPYCVRRYTVEPRLGGAAGLAAAREALARRGLRLVLDFMPNHVARDHPWVTESPEYFIHGNLGDLERAPSEFFASGGRVFACARDPHFPPWTDVAQLNAFHPWLRRALVDTLSSIAEQCDGVRCDMAMLVMNDVFERTWGPRAGERPAEEFWPEVLPAVRAKRPGFLFIAEAYWDLEWDLQEQGFDFCYDKRLYDRLLHGSADGIELHLRAELRYQRKLLRFIENHDEPRAAASFSARKLRAAAVTFATLPGAKLIHEGQLEGRKIRLPIQLGRRPPEAVDLDLRTFYRKLLGTLRPGGSRDGEWSLCERSGWPDNSSHSNLLAWCWRREKERLLIVVNFSDAKSQGRIRLPWEDLRGRSWRLTDDLGGVTYERSGGEMLGPGLYVDLEGWGFHSLRFR